jgi:hypothetical protein
MGFNLPRSGLVQHHHAPDPMDEICLLACDAEGG